MQIAIPKRLDRPLRGYAEARGLSVAAAAARLLDVGLRATRARSAGAKMRAANMTAAERQENARVAARARWGVRGPETPTRKAG